RWHNPPRLFWPRCARVVSSWPGDSHVGPWPAAAYGGVLLFAGVAYYILSRVLVRHHGKDSELAAAVGTDRKGQLSLVIYAVGIALSFRSPQIACGLYVLVAVIWLIPDRRIEAVLSGKV